MNFDDDDDDMVCPERFEVDDERYLKLKNRKYN
jgi:hypothetical protein